MLNHSAFFPQCSSVTLTTANNYFPIQHYLGGLYNRNGECYPSKAQWSLYIPPDVTINNSTFCPHNVFVLISEQTAIISLHNINWLVCITETECLLRGTDWVFIYNSGSRMAQKTKYLQLNFFLTHNSVRPIRHKHSPVLFTVTAVVFSKRHMTPCAYSSYYLNVQARGTHYLCDVKCQCTAIYEHLSPQRRNGTNTQCRLFRNFRTPKRPNSRLFSPPCQL